MNVYVANYHQQRLVKRHSASAWALLALGRCSRPHLNCGDDLVDNSAQVVEIFLVLHIVLKLEVGNRAASKLPLLANTLIFSAVVV